MRWQNEIKIENALYLAVYVENVVCDRWTETVDLHEDRLLELRVFGEDGEFRAWRPDLAADFRTRTIIDTDPIAPHFDEVHYLDIDSRYTVPEGDRVRYRTTGGGAYTLPGEFDRVQVRSYLRTGMNGMTYTHDWRVVRLMGVK